ncbi:MAG: carbohydrate binding domain-containing protein [Sedimentisphaerales bacterium]|nr:carbohydrate binding domain-containing protein [Sedimentisphaerales bacterium]
MKKTLIVLMIMILLTTSQAFAANSLYNPGFEDPGATATGADVWAMWPETIALVYHQNDPLAHDGDDFMELAYPPETWGVLYQDTGSESPATAGNQYTFGAYMRLPAGGSTVNAAMKVEWYANSGEPHDNVISEPEQPIVIASETWTVVSATVTAPAGANYGKVVFVAAADPYYIDDAFFCEGTSPCIGPTEPDPADGSFVDPCDFDNNLSWTNSEPVCPGDAVSVDVWYRLDDPNVLGGTKIVDKQAVSTVNIVTAGQAAVVLDHDYFWTVITYDPDTCGDGEDIIEGPVWSFTTINTAPAVTAGFDQNAWLESGTVTVDLNGDVTDDVDNYPGPLTWQWSATGGVIDDDMAIDTTITFTAPGTYTVTLDASDGDLPGTDSFDITVYAEGTAGDYLVAHYPFDVDASDATGHGHNGTYNGDATVSGADTQVGAGALLLDGTDDYVYIADSADPCDPCVITWADFGSSGVSEEVTISVWIKPAEWSTSWTQIVSKGFLADPNESGYRLTRPDYDSAVFTCGGLPWDNGTVWGGGQYTLGDGSWHHLAAVWDGGRVALYIDGNLQYYMPEPHGTLLLKNGMQLQIGANQGADSSQHFNGLIDDVRIYDVGLSHAEVLKLYASQGGSGTCGLEYADIDLTQNCVVNLEDFNLFAAEWLDCRDPITCP